MDETNEAIKALKTLDDNLKCAICHEYFTTPVTLSCSHTFCSRCIRRALSFKTECPSCRSKDVSATSLLPIRALEDVVQNFHTLKKKLAYCPLDIWKFERPEPKFKTQSPRASLGLKKSAQKSPAKGIAGLFSKVQTSKKRKLDSRPKNEPPLKKKKHTLNSFFSQVKDKPAVKKVPCPNCGVEISLHKVNSHLDRCLASESGWSAVQKESKQYTKKRATQRMPSVHYSSKKPKDLREMCLKFNFPTKKGNKSATRADLTHWHRELRIRHNAEGDSLNPKTDAALVREILKEENAAKTRKFMDKFKTNSVAQQVGDGKSFEQKVKEMRKQMKKNRKKKRKKRTLDGDDVDIDLTNKPKKKTKENEIQIKKIKITKNENEPKEKLSETEEPFQTPKENTAKVKQKPGASEQIANTERDFETEELPPQTFPEAAKSSQPKSISPPQAASNVNLKTENLSQLRIVWSSRVNRPFYFNVESGIGSFDPPDETPPSSIILS